MISREQFESAQQQAREYLSRAGIIITPEEAKNIEVADFGLHRSGAGGLRQHGSRLRQGACALPPPDLPGALPSARGW